MQKDQRFVIVFGLMLAGRYSRPYFPYRCHVKIEKAAEKLIHVS